MLKIVHLTSAHQRYDTRIFLKECVSLAQHGYDVFLIVADGKGDEVKNGVKIADVGPNTGGRLSRMTKTVYKIYEKAKELNGDVYHFHDPELMLIGLGLKIAGKKVIYDVHEDVPKDILSKQWIPLPFRKMTSCIIEKVENFISRKFDAIVTPTDHLLGRFRSINNVVVSCKNYPIISNQDETYVKKSNQLCYVSSYLSLKRGIYEIVEAMEQIDAKMILAGRMDIEIKKDLEKMPGWSRIDYIGFVDHEEANRIIKESIIGISVLYPTPNYVNALPTKMFEYMLFRTAVVSTNTPVVKEIIDKYHCGLCIESLSAKNIADSIKLLLQNLNLTTEMGLNGQKAIISDFNWEAESRKLINVYKHL
jgi:glycosyltransferase involved in cell wall biosynthesis